MMLVQRLTAEINNAGLPGAPVRALDRIGSPAFKNAVADATEKFRLTLQNGEACAVLVSSLQGSDLVGRAVANQHAARSRLKTATQQPVEPPLFTGSVDGRTFAIWPWRQALSQHRIVAAIQRRILSYRVFRWLREVTRDSLLPVLTAEQVSTNYLAPLQAALESTERPELFRNACRVALDQLQSGQLKPVHILQHSDLWLGNVLRHRRSQFGFIVIDWAGARQHGYPFLDLTRFAMSSRAGRHRVRVEFEYHSKLIGCEPSDAPHFAAAGLAMIGLELEFFPVERYHQLCIGTLAFLDSVIRPD